MTYGITDEMHQLVLHYQSRDKLYIDWRLALITTAPACARKHPTFAQGRQGALFYVMLKGDQDVGLISAMDRPPNVTTVPVMA